MPNTTDDFDAQRPGSETGAGPSDTSGDPPPSSSRSNELDPAFLSALLENLSDGVVACDADGTLRYFNRATREIQGKREAAIGLQDWASHYSLFRTDGVTPLTPDEVPLFRALRDGRTAGMEIVIHPPGAAPRRVICRGRAVYGPDGAKLGAVVVMHDVTPLHEAATDRNARLEEEMRRTSAEELAHRLRESEQRYRVLIDLSPQVVWMADASGTQTFFNDYWYRLTGRSRENSVTDAWLDVLHPDDRAHISVAWQAAVRERQPFQEELRVYSAGERTYKWFLVKAVPYQSADGSPLQWLGTGTDISDRKAVEAALQSNLAALEQLNQVGQSVHAELRLEPLLQAVTDAAVKVTGAQFGAFVHNVVDERGGSHMLYTLSGAPHEKFSSFPMPRDTEAFGLTFAGYGIIRSDDITRDPAYGKHAPHAGMPDGHLPVCSYLAVPVRSRTGEVFGGIFLGHASPARFTSDHEYLVSGIAVQAAIGIANSKLYQQQETLLEAERGARATAERESRLKEDFLNTLSHELRTPLNAIVGWADVLQRRHAEDADLSKGLAIIDRNARAQAQIIDDLLDMSRITSGNIRLDVQTVHLGQIITQAIESVQPAADAKQITVHKILDTNVGPVRGDPARLQQILWNLLTNAVKFTPKGGRVQVTLERSGSHVQISVVDSGRGIEPAFLPFIFDRFRQADGSITREYGGLGLGLAIVKSLVELHGGRIRAASAGAGQGAAFAVQLPVSVVQQESSEEPGANMRPSPVSAATATPLPRLDGISVLVVDDERDTLELMRTILSDAGA
ncbi:MAG: two-component hybrid sensor and regulator, partial [Noviherbaspirillum sp.]|nr:two-component hybrid sensor and regulator [Noviherbaspirillum sp.]